MFKPKVPKKKLKKAADAVKADPTLESAQHNITDESGFDLLRDRVSYAHPKMFSQAVVMFGKLSEAYRKCFLTLHTWLP